MSVPNQPDQSQPSSGNEERRRSGGRRLFIGAALLVVGIVVVIWLAGSSEPVSESVEKPAASTDVSPAPAPAPVDPEHRWRVSEFVGSQTCADCHAEIAETFADHPMANTLASVADASRIEIVEGDPARFETQGCRYQIERIGDRMVHTESMVDDNGNLLYEQAEDVQYVVGSGVNARTYLVDRGGIMFESPMTWYTDAQRWDLSPGYENNPRERFNRRIPDDCVQCHSGRVAPVGDGTTGHFQEQPFPEMGIGCERCHGPGKQHVEFMESGDWDDTDDDMLIVNPAGLEGRFRDSICNQCHMEGKRRILRQGRSFHDFQPGMATEDVWTVFVSPTPFDSDGTARFTSHVEQMRSSACFLGAEGSMRCTTCHDPHQVPRSDERVAYYRDRCNSCHADDGCSAPVAERQAPPANDSCIYCHMPMIGSTGMPHTSLSDHRILRTPDNDSDPEARPQRGEIWTIFDGSDQRMPEWEVQRARALGLSDQAILDTDQRLLRQAITALEDVLEQGVSDVEILRSLGFLYGALQKNEKARDLFEAAVEACAHDEKSLKNLGLMALRTGKPRLGLQSYRSYLTVNKWDGTMYGPYAALLANTGDLKAAVEAAEFGLRLDPTQRELRGLAGQLHLRLGNRNTSMQHRRLLQEISSRLEPFEQKRHQRNRKKLRRSLQRKDQ